LKSLDSDQIVVADGLVAVCYVDVRAQPALHDHSAEMRRQAQHDRIGAAQPCANGMLLSFCDNSVGQGVGIVLGWVFMDCVLNMAIGGIATEDATWSLSPKGKLRNEPKFIQAGVEKFANKSQK
jgi:hypothetical protein